MLKSKEDVLIDKIFRNAYGNDYTWDGGTQKLAKRKGVGTIEDGPTIPKVTIPTGKVGNVSHKKVKGPMAQAAGATDTAGTTTLADINAQTRALSKARAYIKANS